MQDTIRVGIVGLGGNTRLRHVPGLRACPGVEIVGVCNRSPESTAAVAREFNIPRTYVRWDDLVLDPSIDAVVIGTWPYLHAPITIAALDAGKHVLTEARMAMNLAEARRMLAASRRHPALVAQIVPSPFGLRCDRVMKEMVADGFIGSLREVVVLGASDQFADAGAPLHWRQVKRYSGVNMLTLGILHETLSRWVPAPRRVWAQCRTFIPRRVDPAAGQPAPVETPDSVRVLTDLEGGACGLYHFSAVAHFGPGSQIHLYGSEGTLKYLLVPQDRLLAGRAGEAELHEVAVPPEKAGGWRVEAEFIDAIRGRGKIEFTDFAAGVSYMQFTDAVARSAESGLPIDLPLPNDAGV
jgi:predicted dehydrogenase